MNDLGLDEDMGTPSLPDGVAVPPDLLLCTTAVWLTFRLAMLVSPPLI